MSKLHTSYQARLFIALPIPQQNRVVLNQLSQKLQERWGFRRWLHPNDYHITLKFIGECDFQQALLIKDQLRDISNNIHSFQLRIGKLGTFNNRSSSKILWAGVHGDLLALQSLRNQIEDKMELIGFAKEINTYRPHISLARNYTQGILHKEELLLAPSIKEHTITWTVKELVLYQTHLGITPAYQPLAVYPFHV